MGVVSTLAQEYSPRIGLRYAVRQFITAGFRLEIRPAMSRYFENSTRVLQAFAAL